LRFLLFLSFSSCDWDSFSKSASSAMLHFKLSSDSGVCMSSPYQK
jgi:hypothetical protein